MSWEGLANNQTVSFNNLQNAVSSDIFVAKTTIPSSNEQITKADADTYVDIYTSFAPYSAKTSNQLVVKSNLQAGSIGIVDFISDSPRTLQLVVFSGGNQIGNPFIASEDCVFYSKTRAVAPITTTGLVIQIRHGSANFAETFDYVFRILDRTGTTTLYTNSGTISLPANTGDITTIRPSGFTIGVGYIYWLQSTSTSCPL
jgi:hypothetical protein